MLSMQWLQFDVSFACVLSLSARTELFPDASLVMSSGLFMYDNNFSDNRGVTEFSRISTQKRRAVSIKLCRTFDIMVNMPAEMLSNVLYSFGIMPSTELSK